MPNSALFEPVTIRGVEVRNRIWASPMCQYSADGLDGVATDWHLVNLGAFAQGGAGLVLTEAAAVSPEGRISAWDLGIWNETQRDALAGIVAFVHSQGATAGIQLAHAGRKASTYPEWRGTGTHPISDGGWRTLAPSAIAFDGYDEPLAMTTQQIEQVVTDFTRSAELAVAAGFDVLELHAAHGYLLHQFLSPLSNERTDAYGGSLENRARLLLDVVRAIRGALGETPILVRLSGTDWIDGAWSIEDTETVAGWAADAGADWFDVSSGGNAAAHIPVGPGYQVPLATAVKTATGMPVNAVGMITDYEQAEEIVSSGKADAVMLARALLREPHWPLLAAEALGAEAPWPPQYGRAAARKPVRA